MTCILFSFDNPRQMKITLRLSRYEYFSVCLCSCYVDEMNLYVFLST